MLGLKNGLTDAAAAAAAPPNTPSPRSLASVATRAEVGPRRLRLVKSLTRTLGPFPAQTRHSPNLPRLPRARGGFMVPKRV